MNKRIGLWIILCFITQLTFAQEKQKYTTLVREAEHLYDQQKFLESGQKYTAAFIAFGNRGFSNDRYNAACSWALANQVDSAFVQLFKIAQNANYKDLDHITTDTDLNALHADQRWTEVIAIVKSNKEKAEAHLDKKLAATLDTVYETDQKYRQQLSATMTKYGGDSPQVKALWKSIQTQDSLNVILVTKILDERGWLGEDVVGEKGNTAFFLVIQHTDIQTQEKYLPLMRQAVTDGKANAANLALLEDRVALRTGKKQIYGSQIGTDSITGVVYVLPLEDPEHVNERRTSVGLDSIEDYIAHWGLTWNVEAYKKQLAEMEARKKK